MGKHYVTRNSVTLLATEFLRNARQPIKQTWQKHSKPTKSRHVYHRKEPVPDETWTRLLRHRRNRDTSFRLTANFRATTLDCPDTRWSRSTQGSLGILSLSPKNPIPVARSCHLLAIKRGSIPFVCRAWGDSTSRPHQKRPMSVVACFPHRNSLWIGEFMLELG